MKTELEKTLWRMLYKSQLALGKRVLADMNANAAEGAWPAGQKWHECNGSSHAIFFRRAREEAGIDHDAYLKILRHDEDAYDIADDELEQELQKGKEADR